MREVEGNRDPWHAVRREPLFRQPEMRSEANTLCGELGVQAAHARFERRSREPEPQIAEPPAEQRLVVEPGPRRLARGLSTGPRPPRPRPAGHGLRAAAVTAASVRARRSRMRVSCWSSKSRRRKLSSIAHGDASQPVYPAGERAREGAADRGLMRPLDRGIHRTLETRAADDRAAHQHKDADRIRKRRGGMRLGGPDGWLERCDLVLERPRIPERGARRIRQRRERLRIAVQDAAQHRREVAAGIDDERRLVSGPRGLAGQRDRCGCIRLDQRCDDRARQAGRAEVPWIVRSGHRLPAPAIGRERARDVRGRLLWTGGRRKIALALPAQVTLHLVARIEAA